VKSQEASAWFEFWWQTTTQRFDIFFEICSNRKSAWRVCDQAPTGGEALEMVKKNPPDMILLDFQMPDLRRD
jgi:CheY-like chemotaxis protein